MPAYQVVSLAESSEHSGLSLCCKIEYSVLAYTNVWVFAFSRFTKPFFFHDMECMPVLYWSETRDSSVPQSLALMPPF